MSRPLTKEFFAGHTVDVARALLGCVVEANGVVLRIVETEAYRHDDTACHAHRGQTARNAPMFGPPGHLYVYRCYGIHSLLNLVTEAEGKACAVLVRGGVVVQGDELVLERRGGRLDCIGPGKVGQALGLDPAWSGRALGDGLTVREGRATGEVVVGPRVGIDYAAPADRVLPWRFRLRLG